jgi:anion-transporting  ArsA/GET3 family ATPase
MSLLDLRFVMLSGKGGVGRTTVAAAMARVGAAAGKRVLLAEAATTDRLGRMFGRAPLGTRVEAIAERIDAVNITPESALHEYGLLTLHSELVTRALFENRAVRGFLGAIPGLDAYAVLGKVWWHTTEVATGRPRYDLVIFDAPATGHATLMLRIPDAILEAMPKGPLARDARAIRDLLHDPVRAALTIVTLPEALPARETADLAATTRSLGIPLGPLIVNAVPDAELSGESVTAVLARHAGPDRLSPQLEATLRLAERVRAHRRAADAVIESLKANPGLPMLRLPRIPTVDIGPALIDALVPALAAGLSAVNP